jgi:hypothetical protein
MEPVKIMRQFRLTGAAGGRCRLAMRKKMRDAARHRDARRRDDAFGAHQPA